MPRLTLMEMELLLPCRQVVLTTRQLDPELTGDQLRDLVTKLLPPEKLFGDDVQKFSAMYHGIRDYLNQLGVNKPFLSSRNLPVR